MSDLHARIAANLATVRQRMAEAAARSGRPASAVTLVAVTKYVGTEEAAALAAAGCNQLGESRPQELWSKADSLRDARVDWHLVGHLQRNKVRRTLPCVRLIHSADSVRLLEEIERVAGELGQPASVLLEVNISGEAAKHGFAADEVEAALPQLAALAHVRVTGLMAMAGLAGDLDDARREFTRLRELRDRLAVNCPPEIQLDELSMGMSGDYVVAIEEGATIVRVGSALFEGIG